MITYICKKIYAGNIDIGWSGPTPKKSLPRAYIFKTPPASHAHHCRHGLEKLNATLANMKCLSRQEAFSLEIDVNKAGLIEDRFLGVMY